MTTKEQAKKVAMELLMTSHYHKPNKVDQDTCDLCGRNFRAHFSHGESVQSRIVEALLTFNDERLKVAREFIRDMATNWDCDTGANGTHPTYCRACNAKSALELLGKETE